MNRIMDTGRYEILYDLAEGDYGERAVGGIRTRTIRAGDSLEVESFPITRIDTCAREEAKRRKTTIAQQRLNDRNAQNRIRRLLETNFTSRDIVLHPTFDYGFIDRGTSNVDDMIRAMRRQGLPMDEDDARKIIRNFIKRLRRKWIHNGGRCEDFKYLYVVESTREPRDGDDNPLPARYHFHMVISGAGILSIDDINAAWDRGYTKAQALDMRYNGLAGLAKYISKQLGKRHRRWACSQNLSDPEIRISNRKISRRRAAMVAADVQANAREIFAKLYPEYALEEAVVKYSAFVAGAYIYARMRRRRN